MSNRIYSREREGSGTAASHRLRHRPHERPGGAFEGIDFPQRSLPEALDAFESDPVLPGALVPVIATEHPKIKRSELSARDLHAHSRERRMYLEHRQARRAHRPDGQPCGGGRAAMNLPVRSWR